MTRSRTLIPSTHGKNDTPTFDKQQLATIIIINNNKERPGIMENEDETLSLAIANAEYYSTEMNAIFGNEIIGVVTEKTFTPEQIARYDLPKYMAWNTGARAEYDVSNDEYIGFDSLQDMADYIAEESPIIEDEQ